MPFLEFSGITKRFPGVLALDGVSFSVERGTCHALIGENGAGKSTLGKILAGVHPADSGELKMAGRIIQPTTPLVARELGIAMVHQELAFCPNLSVAENLCLGDLPRRAGFVNHPELRARARAMLATIGADIDPDTIIGTLSTGREQLVQIAAAVGTGAKVIVMDEPSSSLSATETAELFRLVRELKARGITLIYVSHRIEELFAICDNITVLRDGHHVATESIASTPASTNPPPPAAVQPPAPTDNGSIDPDPVPCGPEFGPDAPPCPDPAATTPGRKLRHAIAPPPAPAPTPTSGKSQSTPKKSTSSSTSSSSSETTSTTDSYDGIHRHHENHAFARMIVEADLTSKDKIIFNLIGLWPEGSKPAWGYACGVRHSFSHMWATGLEAIGDFGEANEHELVLGGYCSPNHHLALKIGAGMGLTSSSPDFSVRTGVIWRF